MQVPFVFSSGLRVEALWRGGHCDFVVSDEQKPSKQETEIKVEKHEKNGMAPRKSILVKTRKRLAA